MHSSFLSARHQGIYDLISSPLPVDTERLRALAWHGCPARVRHQVWCLLLGYYPVLQTDRACATAMKAAEYAEYVNTLHRPFDWDKICGDHDSNGSIGGMPPEDEMIDYEEVSTMRQIRKDVPRTAGGVAFIKHARIQLLLERVLYIWAVRHPASGYLQGMNDLILPFVYVCFAERLIGGDRIHELLTWPPETVACYLSTDHQRHQSSTSLPKGCIRLTEQDLLRVEAEIYWLSCNFLLRVQDHFSFSEAGSHYQVQKMERLIEITDPALVHHLQAMDITFLQFAFRWMMCFLLREFTVSQAINIWDTYVSERDFSKFHVYVCAALLRKWSKELIQITDFVELIKFLQCPPTQVMNENDLRLVCSEAELLKQLYEPYL